MRKMPQYYSKAMFPELSYEQYERRYLQAFKEQVVEETAPIPPKAWAYLGQSRKHSLFESIANVVVGFIISTGANWIVLPWFGHSVSVRDSAGIGLVLTVVSVVRSYVLRRVYNQIYLKTGI